jgi:DNA-directed DNA polymerase III PolC
MWGVHYPEELCGYAAESGLKAIALTDINNLYGLREFLESAEKHDITPIIGTELSHNNESVVILAKNRTGFSSICRIISEKNLKQDFEIIPCIVRNSEGIIVIAFSEPVLVSLAGRVENLFAGLSWNLRNFYTLAKKSKIEPVACPRIMFLQKDDFFRHRVLRAVALKKTLSTLSDRETAFFRDMFLSVQQISSIFETVPEAVENTLKIREMCTEIFSCHKDSFPDFSGDLEKDFEVLKRRTYEGALRRYACITEEIKNRIEHELKIIKEKKFASYFLVAEDVAKFTERTCGRGSAAASIVSYCLKITNVDPVRHNLFFERFLNPARTDPPDIDIDFAWDERDGIIDKIFEKYGRERAAMVSTHQTMCLRSSIRETARVFGVPEKEISLITRKIPYFFSDEISLNGDLLSFVCSMPEMKNVKICSNFKKIFDTASRIMGLPRTISVHCGGVVITKNLVSKYAPLQRAAKGVVIVQWEKNAVEDFGLVKMDILGNRSLAVVRDAMHMVRENHGDVIDEKNWIPEQDRKTMDLIANGDTIGVFYIESPAMRQLQKKTHLGDFESITLHSSIIRPAAHRYINEYVEILKGKRKPVIHPVLSDVLKETYGILCYQEDIIKVSQAMAGFSIEQGDKLRKILAKKDRETKLNEFREKFFTGARAKAIPEQYTERIWNNILSFSGYSFCKPHSASYAMVSFQSAFLKAHYPAEFLAAVMKNRGGYYTTWAYVSEAKRMGIRVVPPDVTESSVKFAVSDNKIITGLSQIHGIRIETAEKIAEERRKKAFDSFEDFFKRTGVIWDEVHALHMVNAFKKLPSERKEHPLWAYLHFKNRQNAKEFVNESLFSYCPKTPFSTYPVIAGIDSGPRAGGEAIPSYCNGIATLPSVARNDRDEIEQAIAEMKILGFPCSIHPLKLFEKQLGGIRRISARDMHKFIGNKITVAGWLVTLKNVITKTGESMSFVSFEDEDCIYEAIFFPDTYKKFCHAIESESPYILKGKVVDDHGALSIDVEEMESVS